MSSLSFDLFEEGTVQRSWFIVVWFLGLLLSTPSMGDFWAVLFYCFHRMYVRVEQYTHAQNCARMLRIALTCSGRATSHISKVSNWSLVLSSKDFLNVRLAFETPQSTRKIILKRKGALELSYQDACWEDNLYEWWIIKNDSRIMSWWEKFTCRSSLANWVQISGRRVEGLSKHVSIMLC